MVGIAFAIAGIALVSFARDAEGELASGSLLGALLLLGAVFCESLYVVLGKKLSARIGPKRISALINVWGLVLVTPLALWQLPGFAWNFIPQQSWVLLVVYAISASVLTVWLWMTGMKRVPASSAGVFTVFLPVSAAAVGVMFLGEQVTAARRRRSAWRWSAWCWRAGVRGRARRPDPPRAARSSACARG
jgi:drug/metabolite transporter (DMT)-like permease